MDRKKKTKKENPFVLGAEVGLFKPGHGLTALGRIIRISQSLVTVKWDTNMVDSYGLKGQSFHGRVTNDGEANLFSLSGKRLENLWGGDDDPHLFIPSEEAKQRLAEKRKEKEQREADRKAETVARESDPAYQKHQSDLKRFSALLQEVSGSVDTSWNNRETFRIELENIPGEQMEELIAAIRKVRQR
jgi:hypothetical protein